MNIGELDNFLSFPGLGQIGDGDRNICYPRMESVYNTIDRINKSQKKKQRSENGNIYSAEDVNNQPDKYRGQKKISEQSQPESGSKIKTAGKKVLGETGEKHGNNKAQGQKDYCQKKDFF